MGNTEGLLKNYELDKDKEILHEDWSIIPGKVNSTSVCLFSAHLPKSSKKRAYIERAFQASKVYRHPGLLRYIDGGMTSNEVMIVMEEAIPLPQCSLQSRSTLQIMSGLSSVIEALIFLHDKAGVSHNNISASSIYVTSDGIWKLWGLEYSCSFAELTRDHIERINQYCYEIAIPPEDKSEVTPAYQHARDSYAVAKFIVTRLASFLDKDTSGFIELVAELEANYLNADWSKRQRLCVLSQHSFFRHGFLQLKNDISHLLLFPETQKQDFIRSLPAKLQMYPEQLVASTLAHTLFSRTLLLTPSATEHLFPVLLRPRGGKDKDEQGLFSAPVFAEFVIPIIVDLFAIHDATIRLALLDHFSYYAPLIEKPVLAKDVLPELLLGIRDTNESLAVSTLRCLAMLVPILGADVVIGKNREHLFTSSRPKVTSHGLLECSLSAPSSLPMTIKPELTDKGCDGSESSEYGISLDDLSLQDTFLPCPIPERSSPDGGEVEKFPDVQSTTDVTNGVPVQWQDWEDTTEANQLPKKRASDKGKVDSVYTNPGRTFDMPQLDVFQVELEHRQSDLAQVSREQHQPERTEEQTHQDSASLEYKKHFLPKKGAVMKLGAHNKQTKSKPPLGLGEEYDIMSIHVKRKPEAEVDFFADIKPVITAKTFDLEHMLQEANRRCRSGSDSSFLTAALTDSDPSQIQEGDGWNEFDSIELHENIDSTAIPNFQNEALAFPNKEENPELHSKEAPLWDNDWG